MQKKIILQIFVIALVLVNTVVLAMLWWQKQPANPALLPGNARDFLVKELNLSLQQQEQFTMFREEHFSAMELLRRETMRTKDAFFKNVSSETLDSVLIESQIEIIGANEKKKDLLTLDHFRKVRGILTNEQKKKFDNILKKVLHMMRPPGRNGPPGRPGRERPTDEEMEIEDQGRL